MKRISRSEREKIFGLNFGISEHDKDEMAIPSYLHRNPFIQWLIWRKFEKIAYLCDFRQDMHVLDFGCGTGMFLPELRNNCDKVWAIDLFPEYAKELSARYNLDIMFAQELADIPDNSLDVIVAANVLEHLQYEELMSYLSIFREKLKSGGKLVVSGPTENFAYKIGRFIAGFSGKGDYHHTNIDALIKNIDTYFPLQKTETLPFAFSPHLYKICAFGA